MIRVPQAARPRERGSASAVCKTFVPCPPSSGGHPERPSTASAPQPNGRIDFSLAKGLHGAWREEGETAKGQLGCRLTRVHPDVALVEHINPKGKRWGVTGVATCKFHMCPMCASKWAATRAGEITEAVGNWGAERVRFLTLTMKHHSLMLLALQNRLLSGAYGQLWSGRDGQAFAEQVGGKPESVRALDRTWSLEQSWHPHIHALVFLQQTERSDGELAELFGERWPVALGLQLRRMKRCAARVLARTDEPLGTIGKLLELDMSEPLEAKKATRFRRNILKKQGPLDDGSCEQSRGCGCLECVKRRVRRVIGSKLVPQKGDFLEHVRRVVSELHRFTQSNIEPRESTNGVHLERVRNADQASTYLSKLGLEIAWNQSKEPNVVHGIAHYPYWALAHLVTMHGHPLRVPARKAWTQLARATRGQQQIVFSSRDKLGLGPDPYADDAEPPDAQPGDFTRLIGTIAGGDWDRLKRAQKHGLLETLHVAHSLGVMEQLPYLKPPAGMHGVPSSRGPPERYVAPSPLERATRTAAAEQRGRALACLLTGVQLPDLHVDPIRWATASTVTVEDIQQRIQNAKQLRLNYQIDW